MLQSRPRFLVLAAWVAAGWMALLSSGCREEWSGPCPAGQPCDGTWNWPAAQSPSQLLSQLQRAYSEMNYERFATLFSASDDGVPYLYVTDDSLGTTWDLIEELRIHRRIFAPEDPLPGETPLPRDLWLVSIDMQLEPQSEWTERPYLYRSEANPFGLDPARWRAVEAEYLGHVFMKTQGQTDYSTTVRGRFVVIEDRLVSPGSARRFTIYRWVDLGGWTAFKRMLAFEPKVR